MEISVRAQSMPESPIRKLAKYADEAKLAGIHVYHLNIGQPDIKTPPQALEAVKNLTPRSWNIRLLRDSNLCERRW